MSKFIILTQTELEEMIKVSGAGIETNKGESAEHAAIGRVAALQHLYKNYLISREEAIDRLQKSGE